MAASRHQWILLALLVAPMDRIHIMKSLFLVWYRSHGKIPDYFQFEPYLYGPCSFEVYSTLQSLMDRELVIQPSDPDQKSADYYLTKRGKKAARFAARAVSREQRELVHDVVHEVCQLSFRDLLRRVYAEAPEFAVKSLVKSVIQR